MKEGSAMTEILAIDDDREILAVIKKALLREGYQVTALEDPLQLEEDKLGRYQLILLDVMMPGIDGFDLCRRIREKVDCPILFLTAKTEEKDVMTGLGAGGDDYITKPFSVKEVLARITSVLRRYKYTSNEKVEVLKADDIQVNVNKHIVTKNGTEIELTLKEFQILKLLIENRGNVLTRTFLLDKIWGYDYYGETRTLDVHIRNLRKKIGDDDAKYIETIRGVGYKIK